MLERGGFLRSVAGDDFDVAVNAVRTASANGTGILLSGGCGTGKTLFMRTVAGMRSRKSRQWYWIDCADADSAWLLNRRENSRIRELLEYDLFIDDFGTEISVEYGRRVDFVADFIRLYAERGEGRLFVTTNLTGRGMLDAYDERVVDRLMDICVAAKFTGRSHRNRASANAAPAEKEGE